MPISQINTNSIANGAVVQADLATGVAGTGPAFSAYPSSGTSLSSAADTKVLFQNEDFDSNSCFSSSRFTPNVAGYYLISAGISVNASVFTTLYVYKNGVAFRAISANYPAGDYYSYGSSVAVYLNGTTDYVEIYANTSSSTTNNSDTRFNYFQGFLLRAA